MQNIIMEILKNITAFVMLYIVVITKSQETGFSRLKSVFNISYVLVETQYRHKTSMTLRF